MKMLKVEWLIIDCLDGGDLFMVHAQDDHHVGYEIAMDHLQSRGYMLHPVAGRYPIAIILYNICWCCCKVSTIPYSRQFTYI